jgi:type I restriction enzyme S subunit
MSRHRFQSDTVSYFPALPSGWREERLNDIVELRTSNVDKKSEVGEKAVRLCNYVDVYKNDKITMDLDFMEATATGAQIERFALRVGDVVITKDSETPDDIGVPALIAATALDLVCGYHLTILRPDQNEVSGGYLFYAVASRLSAYQFYLAANGVTRFGLTYQGTKNLRIALPSVIAQQQIAAYLDWKTAQIEALIARKQELLDKLNEERIAIIAQAVTKGLNPAAPMRDSGIPWLGQVPRHWQVKKLSRVTASRCDGPFGSGLKSEHYTDEGVRVVRLQNIEFAIFDDVDKAYIDPAYYRELGDHDVYPGDLLVAGLGDTNNPVGRACRAPDNLGPAMVKADCFRYRLESDKADSQFMAYQMSVTAMALSGALASGVTRPRMNLSLTSARIFAFPPADEQITIAKYLDAESEKFQRMTEKVNAAIARLTEYRTALITAATTGKIDVRSIKLPAQA